MGRYINPETAGKERTQLTRATILALRELMLQTEPNDDARDLAAFIAISLQAVAGTIESSVTPWEKRDYWVKADRFRMEWSWAGLISEQMRKAVLAEDWMSVARLGVQIAQKLSNVKLPQRHRLGTPWIGAYNKLKS